PARDRDPGRQPSRAEGEAQGVPRGAVGEGPGGEARVALSCQLSAVSSDSNRSRTSSARPGSARSTSPDAGVASGVISTVKAPWSLAPAASAAAGYTTDEVPTTRQISQSSARSAASSAATGIASPNQTTPGRSFPPQCGQGGGSFGKGTVSS